MATLQDIANVILLSLSFLSFVSGVSGGTIYLSCKPDNDLYNVLKSNGIACSRFSDPRQAIDNAEPRSGVMILADGYPQVPTPLDDALCQAATQKNLRLYIEFPAYLPQLAVGSVRSTHLERGVVTSDIFGDAMAVNDLVIIHDCRFVDVDAPNPYMVLAKVAGFDKAVYGLLGTESFPVLFQHPTRENMLVATTKLSQFVTGRYVPKHSWQAIWKMILQWLEPEESFGPLQWTPTVGPTYSRDDSLPAGAQRDSIIRSIDWHYNAKLLVHESWRSELNKYGARNPVGPAPDASSPVGDGTYGLLEGVHSGIDSSDGGQKIRWWQRTDVIGESSIAFALRSLIDGDDRSKTVAANLADWVYFKSGLLHKGDPSDGNYGLLGWAPDTRGAFYQDNDIKAILGCIGTAVILKSDRWDEALARNILGNFRTTGQKGFRTGRLDDPAVTNNGWQYYWRRSFVNFHPHYETWIWASYLWLYDKTGYKPLLERTRQAITLTMNAYPDRWRWTNGFQQERGRMLLALAWLVRVDDTPQHRAWLEQIADDMREDQVACGAIREELGNLSMGQYAPPTSNASYGTNEASLIQQNGDPLADMLYTCNFTFLGLHEAYAATGNDKYLQMENKLAEFFIRIQVSSKDHPELDGAWYRAFDYKLWDYWGSNADAGWGAWSVENGWTQGWITTVLALRETNLNLWDLTAESEIEKVFDPIRQQMMPDDQIALPEPKKVSHAAVGARVILSAKPAPQYSGSGPATVTDGILSSTDNVSGDWLGYQGRDFEAVIDLGQSVAIRSLSANFMQTVSIGVFLPEQVEFAVSNDVTRFKVVSTVRHSTDLKQAGPMIYTMTDESLSAKARYIRVKATNIGRIPEWHPAKGRKAWLFIDEIIVNSQQ